MPNWVFNTLTIEGKKADLEKFMKKASTPYMTYHKGVRTQNADGTWTYDAEAVNEELRESPISFMNFASPDSIEKYFAQADYKPDGYEEMSTQERMAHAMKFSSDGWYDWNVRNWGTKWDACNPEMTSDDPSTGSIGYYFDTAWSPADGAYTEMVKQHPELHFDFYCEEEQGWGVEFDGTDGEFTTTREWNIPESHADHKALDRMDSCICNHSDDPEDWFEDCPNNPKEVAEAVQSMEDISDMIGHG